MYGQIVNNTINLFESLPFRIRLEDGSTRTSLHEKTTEELIELGIYPVVEIKPEYDAELQYLEGPVTTFENNVITATYTVVNKTPERLLEELNSAKTSKKAELAQRRWEKETGGITLPNGMVIKTDRESQSLLAGAALQALADETTTVEWKAANGWVTLDATQIKALAVAVRQHVQACFSIERDLSEQVDAETTDTVSKVNAIVWPES